MKAVLQRCLSASVHVDSELVSEIGKGLFCLVGINTEDKQSDAEQLAKKIVNIRVFDDSDGKSWGASVKQLPDGQILSVSQFTLMAKTRKGTKPDFHAAAAADTSKALYEYFLERLRVHLGDPERVKDGRFQAMMTTACQNDGPVTLLLDTQESRTGKTQPEET